MAHGDCTPVLEMLNAEQIVVRYTSGKTITVDIETDMVIDKVQDITQDQEGIPKEHQNLFFGGKMLKPYYSLRYYHIQNDSIVQLVVEVEEYSANEE